MHSVNPPHVVIGTNLVISALVFSKGRAAELRITWQNQRLQPLVSKSTATELIWVLKYPKFKLDAEDQEELLADYLPYCSSVNIPNPPPETPACRDQFDVPFSAIGLGRPSQIFSDWRSRFTEPR